MVEKETKFVYINGEMLPKEQARISVFDRGLWYGYSVYEGIRVYDGKIFKLDEHIERLYDSAQAISVKIPMAKCEMKQAIIETVKINRFRNCHLRPIVTSGVGKEGIKELKPNVVIMAAYHETEMGSKLRTKTTAVRRVPPEAIDPKIKASSRLDVMLAMIEAESTGVDRALMLDTQGFVSEIAMANIFVVKDEKISTPFTTNCLAGITREVIMTLAKKEGYSVGERNLTLHDLYTADEVFVTGTAEEVDAVVEIDGREINDKELGPVTKRMIELYKKCVQEEGVPIY